MAPVFTLTNNIKHACFSQKLSPSLSVLVDQVSIYKTYRVLINRELNFSAVGNYEKDAVGEKFGKIFYVTVGGVQCACDDKKKIQYDVEGNYDGLNAEKTGQKDKRKPMERVPSVEIDETNVPDSGLLRRVCGGLLTNNDLVAMPLAGVMQTRGDETSGGEYFLALRQDGTAKEKEIRKFHHQFALFIAPPPNQIKQMTESGPDAEAEVGLERSNLTLSDTSEEEEADKMEMDLDNEADDGVTLHHCERCVLIRPLAQIGYEDGEGSEASEGAADLEDVSTLGSVDGQSLVSASAGSSKVYRHCLADFDTAQAARAAAAVAEQLQTQQMLLMAAIDYALVYALHSFVATLEGQVCVLKGDPLALLDDSNSYWWLIGYIPAENIETPSERIARLNRIRNVQLALVTDVDFDQVVFHTDHKKPLRFASSPVVFEEYFLGEEYYDEEDICDEDLTSAAVDEPHANLNLTDENSITTVSVATLAAANASTAISSSLSLNDLAGDASTSKLVVASKKLFDNSNKQQDDGRDDSSISEKRESFWNRVKKNVSLLDAKRGRKMSLDVHQGRPKSTSRTREEARTAPISESPKPPMSSRSSLVNIMEHTTALTHTPPATIRVLRIYSGNVDLNATFKTVAWSEDSTVASLLENSLKRFKISNAASGEYYLSILHFDSQERRLPETENVFKILEQLSNKKLPGLSTSKKVTKILTNSDNPHQQKNNTQILINDDQIIKIIMNKNVNLADLRDDMRLCRVFMVDPLDSDGRMYKTISVKSDMTIGALLVLAYKKFKILNNDVEAYHLITLGPDHEIIRDPSELVYDVLNEQNDLIMRRSAPVPISNIQGLVERPAFYRTVGMYSTSNNNSNNSSAANSSAFQSSSRLPTSTASKNNSLSSPISSPLSSASTTVTKRTSNSSALAVEPSSTISTAPKAYNQHRGSVALLPSPVGSNNSGSLRGDDGGSVSGTDATSNFEAAIRRSTITESYDKMERVLELLAKVSGSDEGEIAAVAL
ncbi:hypothetical protein HK100_005502 [Physocladia obscura]|uniref:Ras-associating domain-containing protein n=1 Tax=Physocladia obscura TaxID=109957 RepID=A0AAD5STN4_9FUNG|nr:hypothetical protein HK100_005502 [Physocladia obscura]